MERLRQLEASIFQDLCNEYRTAWGEGDVARALACGSHLPLGGLLDLPLVPNEGPVGPTQNHVAWRRATSAVNRLVRQAYAQYQLSLWGLRPAEAMRGGGHAAATDSATAAGDDAERAPLPADVHAAPYEVYERTSALFATVGWCGIVAIDVMYERPGWARLGASGPRGTDNAGSLHDDDRRLQELLTAIQSFIYTPGLTTVIIATPRPLTAADVHPLATERILSLLLEWKAQVRHNPRLCCITALVFPRLPHAHACACAPYLSNLSAKCS